MVKTKQNNQLVKYEGNIAEYPFFQLSKHDKDKCMKREFNFGEGRTLTIENIDGIPTAFDANVLMAISYIGTQSNSLDRKIHFTLKELAELLMCTDKSRIKDSIKRLSKTSYTAQGTVLTKHEGKNIYLDSTLIFHIIETVKYLDPQKKKIYNHQQAKEETWVKFNEYFIDNFVENYVQHINWEVYLKLETPTAKRLYTYLEKKRGERESFTIDVYKIAAVIPIESKEGFNIRKLLKEACKHLIEQDIIKNYSFANDNITFEFPLKSKKLIQENKQLSLLLPLKEDKDQQIEKTKEYLKQLVSPSFATMSFALEQIKFKCPGFKGASNFITTHGPGIVLEKLAYGIYTHVFSHPVENLGGWLRTALKENFLSPEGFWELLNETEVNNESISFENIKSNKVQKFCNNYSLYYSPMSRPFLLKLKI